MVIRNTLLQIRTAFLCIPAAVVLPLAFLVVIRESLVVPPSLFLRHSKSNHDSFLTNLIRGHPSRMSTNINSYWILLCSYCLFVTVWTGHDGCHSRSTDDCGASNNYHADNGSYTDWNTNSWGPFYSIGLTLIQAWITNHTHYKIRDEITYPFTNFNGFRVKVWEWIISPNT